MTNSSDEMHFLGIWSSHRASVSDVEEKTSISFVAVHKRKSLHAHGHHFMFRHTACYWSTGTIILVCEQVFTRTKEKYFTYAHHSRNLLSDKLYDHSERRSSIYTNAFTHRHRTSNVHTRSFSNRSNSHTVCLALLAT